MRKVTSVLTFAVLLCTLSFSSSSSSSSSSPASAITDLSSAVSHVTEQFGASVTRVTVSVVEGRRRRPGEEVDLQRRLHLKLMMTSLFVRVTSPEGEADRTPPLSSDLTFLVGECRDVLTHYFNGSNAHLYHRSKRMVLAGDLPCSADAWQLLEATLKESAADRPIKAWLVHREREDEGFSVSAASFWNEVSDPRFYHFGLLPLSVPRLGEDELMSNRWAVLRAVTVGGSLALNWDSLLERQDEGAKEPRLQMRRGLSDEFWDYINRHAGLAMSFVEPAETWGSRKDLKGMTGALARNEADVAVTIMAQCCDREKVFDYTLQIEFRRFWIFFSQPELSSDIYFIQFSNELWLFILLTVAALQLTMGLIIWYNLAVMKRASHAEFDFKDNLSWSLSFVAQQGYERDPKRSSQRVLFFSGFVFSMLVFIAFSANIIAILSQTRSIDTFQALLDYEPIKMVVSAFPYFQLEMRESANAQAQRMMSQYDSNVEEGLLPCSTDQALPCDETIANRIGYGTDVSSAFGGPDDYIFDKKYFTYMGNRFHSCRLTYFQIPMGVQFMSYGMRKHAPYKRDIDLAILRLKETGLSRKMIRDFYPRPPDCKDFRDAYRPVPIYFIYSAYLVLLGGYGLAICIAAGECLHKRMLSNKRAEETEAKCDPINTQRNIWSL